MDGHAIKLAIATVYSGVAGRLQLCVYVCVNDDRKRRSNRRRDGENIKQNHRHQLL